MILGILLHFVFSALIGIILSCLAGQLTAPIALTSLVLGTVAAFYCRNIFSGEYAPNLRKLSIIEIIIYGFITLIGLRFFVYLVFKSGNKIRTLLPSNFGDLPLHIAYIRHIASGASFPPANPYWPSDLLRYPLGIDFYSALWDILGVPLHSHMFLTGIVLLIVSIAILRWWGKFWVVGAFFLNGGWAGWEFLKMAKFADYLDTVAWKNFFITIFVPQRGYLIAIPLGVFLLKTAHDLIKDEKVFSKTQLTMLGFLWGSLALFHIHTFIIISLIIACFLFLYPKLKLIKPVFRILIIAVPIASIFMLYSTNLFQAASSTWTKYGWLAPQGGLLSFWWKNLGPWMIFLLIFFILDLIFGLSKNRREWIMLIVLAVIFNIVMLSKWDWDNIKILLWLYLCFVQLAAVNISKIEKVKILQEKFWLRQSAVSFICIVLFFSGAISLLSYLRPNALGQEIYDYQQLWYTKGAVKDISTDAIIAGEATFNNPLSFWGYKLVMGYSGHLWSHGIDYKQTENKLNALFRGASDWENIAKELKIDYIFWGPRERQKYPNSTTPWKSKLNNISKIPEYEVYSVESFYKD